MVEKSGYSEDFLQLKTPLKPHTSVKRKEKYKCTPENIKKSIVDKINNNEISIGDAINIVNCSRRNIKNWIKSNKKKL